MPIPPSAAARAFADGWIDAWNAHDLDAVLVHYSDDFEFSSPLVIQFAAEPTGTLKGKAAIQTYRRAALASVPTLHFDLVDVLTGVDCLAILYRGHRGLAAELFEFDANGGRFAGGRCIPGLAETRANG